MSSSLDRVTWCLLLSSQLFSWSVCPLKKHRKPPFFFQTCLNVASFTEKVVLLCPDILSYDNGYRLGGGGTLCTFRGTHLSVHKLQDLMVKAELASQLLKTKHKIRVMLVGWKWMTLLNEMTLQFTVWHVGCSRGKKQSEVVFYPPARA